MKKAMHFKNLKGRIVWDSGSIVFSDPDEMMMYEIEAASLDEIVFDTSDVAKMLNNYNDTLYLSFSSQDFINSTKSKIPGRVKKFKAENT